MDTATRTSKRFPRLATMLIVVALVMPAAHVSTANDAATVGPVYPWLSEWQEFTVNVGDTVLLGARWGACSPGLARQGERAISFDYSLDGVPIATDFVWDRPVAVAWDLPGEARCIAGPSTDGKIWLLFAEYPIVFDAPGNYLIGATVTADRTIIDGIDSDGDGRPDKYSGLLHDVVSIVRVVAP